MDRYPYLLGCLLGTALGDAVGLRREGLSPRRAMRLYGGKPLSPNLFWGRGFCSDDTEHTQMVGRALALSDGDPDQFDLELSRQLKRWLLSCPAGIGLATLRACLKLLLGYRANQSGVFSAGNGPAMRSALLGVYAQSDTQLDELVHRCTRVTHTDPKAEEAASVVARAARLQVTGQSITPEDFIASEASRVRGDELRRYLCQTAEAVASGSDTTEFAGSLGWNDGISGYINHSVPAALFCWASSPQNLRNCIENAVLLGGDSDTVGAITGSICGANLGSECIPQDWLDRLAEWPRSVAWMERLAHALADRSHQDRVPVMHWPSTTVRNAGFALVVIMLGIRRLFPPY